MAVYDLEEQEQIASAKAFWKQYGNLITGAIVVAAIGVGGYYGWQGYQNKKTGEASAIYGVLTQAAEAKDSARVKVAAGELVEKHSGTSYAPMGALMAGKVLFDAGDLKSARAQLTWATEHGSNELRDVARLHLAAVLLDDKAYDEALKVLQTAPEEGFAARFAELKGDVLFAQGKAADARTSYQEALSKLNADKAGEGSAVAAQSAGPYKELLQQKLDALGGA